MYTQIPLFNRPPLNIAKQYKMSLHAAAKACHLSREQILDRMNELATINSINLVSNGKLKMEYFRKMAQPERFKPSDADQRSAGFLFCRGGRITHRCAGSACGREGYRAKRLQSFKVGEGVFQGAGLPESHASAGE